MLPIDFKRGLRNVIKSKIYSKYSKFKLIRNIKFVKTREGWSYGVGTEVTWSRHGFNLCVAPSYGNRGVLVFWRAGKRGCPKRGAERMGKLRLGAEGLQRVLFGILVDYKLEFNYLSIPAYIRKGNRDVRRSG